MHINNLSRAGLGIQQSNRTPIRQPAAAFPGIQEQFPIARFIDNFMRVAADHHIRGGVIFWLPPIATMVPYDLATGRLYVQRAINNIW